jgi:sterol desaturase/sphingolipid hydroxylase (fatty acid hydroxylase superfamily)
LIIFVTLVAATTARVVVGDWQWWDAVLPAVQIALFPVNEWVIHVAILHWRPRKIGRATLDSLLARKHREHHADPREIPLIFIPWQTFLWLLPVLAAIALFVFPSTGLGLTYLVMSAVLGLCYEWIHYLVHSDYRPRSRPYRAVWRNHRLHHYKNEHYWFTVTSSGTADRIFGTYPDPDAVRTSGTARALHAS